MYLVKSGTLEATQTFANGKETIVASFARVLFRIGGTHVEHKQHAYRTR